MKKSRLLSAVCAVVLTCITMSANASILKFEFIGETNDYFGPVTSFSGSFLLDTSTPLSELESTVIDGISYISRFNITGGISNFHALLDGVWSLDGPVTSNIGSHTWSPGEWEAWMNFNDSLIRFDFGRYSGAITTQMWMDSPDPVADYFLANGGTNGSFIGNVTIPDDPNYPMGSAGLSYLNVVASTVPIPPALWLFGSGLLGLVGVARRKRIASQFQG